MATPVTQLKNAPMAGDTQLGDEQRDRFPARNRCGYLPLLREAEPGAGEHPLVRAGRMLEHIPVPEPETPGTPLHTPVLQARIDELNQRLRQVQRSLHPEVTSVSLPAAQDRRSAAPDQLHARMQAYLEEWGSWQDVRDIRDPSQELAEFCHSDYMDKLVLQHPLAFLVIEVSGRLLFLSPEVAHVDELQHLNSGDRLEETFEFHREANHEEGWLHARRERSRPLPVRDWPVSGGRLVCIRSGS